MMVFSRRKSPSKCLLELILILSSFFTLVSYCSGEEAYCFLSHFPDTLAERFVLGFSTNKVTTDTQSPIIVVGCTRGALPSLHQHFLP